MATLCPVQNLLLKQVFKAHMKEKLKWTCYNRKLHQTDHVDDTIPDLLPHLLMAGYAKFVPLKVGRGRLIRGVHDQEFHMGDSNGPGEANFLSG